MIKKLFFIIVLATLVFNVSCKKDPISSVNTEPTAAFTINPGEGTTATIFTFDASGSTDNEDATSELEVRWDWNNDGTYDTNYSTNKTATHQYSVVGSYTARLDVKDSGGMTNSESLSLTVNFNYGSVTDIDGNVYQTVKIGNQWWMTENLKVAHYRNGNPIPNVTDGTEWGHLTTGAQCAYDNNDDNIPTYGRLYNWYSVVDPQGLAPTGWHIPSDEEWKELEIYLGMSQTEADDIDDRGTDEGSKLKSTSGWYSDGNGTNESGFSALPAGRRYYYNITENIYGDFNYILHVTGFWSTREYQSNRAFSRLVSIYSTGVLRDGYRKVEGFSIRCISD